MNQADSHSRIAALITKFLRDELTPPEAGELQAWVAENETNRRTWQRMTDPDYLDTHLKHWENTGIHWQQLKDRIADPPSRLRRLARASLKYAAALVLAALLYVLASYFLGTMRVQDRTSPVSATEHAGEVEIMPRGNTARLILANGESIDLDGDSQRSITEADGTRVENQSNLLSYSASGEAAPRPVYNTLLTPRGGEYRIRLPDGTLVWLNASSSLRYPVKYSGDERRVYLTGEAYFEVVKDATRPFVVSSGETEVRVLGTKFNISAYQDDQVTRTTLAEGSVKINLNKTADADGAGLVLKPGYQAVTGERAGKIDVNKVDIDAVLAWKNNMLIFDEEPLSAILRKLSRCYDVDVVYDGELEFHFTGRIEKSENISAILQLLELTGKVRFTLENRTLHVKPY